MIIIYIFQKNSTSFFILLKEALVKLKNETHNHFTHEGSERHVSCLAQHCFTNARKMLWSCVG